MLEWWLEPPFFISELLHAHVDGLLLALDHDVPPLACSPVPAPTNSPRTSIRSQNMMAVKAESSEWWLEPPVCLQLAMVGTMARGRAARNAPRCTNPQTPPRPRCAAGARFRPQYPCRAPLSGAACAISPGNPSLRRSSCPSSPPAPPRTSSGRHVSAGRISAILMQQNDSLGDSESSSCGGPHARVHGARGARGRARGRACPACSSPARRRA